MNKTIINENIKIYTNMCVAVDEEYRNGEISIEEYLKEGQYYRTVLNNWRNKLDV
jgi:hypothetical protein